MRFTKRPSPGFEQELTEQTEVGVLFLRYHCFSLDKPLGGLWALSVPKRLMFDLRFCRSHRAGVMTRDM